MTPQNLLTALLQMDESAGYAVLQKQIASLNDEARQQLIESLKREADKRWKDETHLAYQLAGHLMSIGDLTGSRYTHALGLMTRGEALRRLGRNAEAIKFLDAAGKEFLSLGDELGWARTRIGRVSACLQGRTMMEQILNHTAQEAERPSRREGACGQKPRLVGIRPKQLHTLMGKVTIGRSDYQCVVQEEEPSVPCSHGQAPWDLVWGQIAGRTSPGVQKLLGKLVSRLTLSEAVDTFTDILPLPMSERQALNLIQPLGEALSEQEEEQVQALFEQAANKQTQAWEQGAVLGPSIRRLSIETDGVTARIRRGSVPMEEAEAKRQADVYREIKVGAVFEGMPGRERSKLVPGVFLDEPGPIQYVARRLKVEEFGRFLYALAQRCGVDRAQEVVILGGVGARWIRHVVEDHFPNAVHIVDLSHAREHLWNVANAVHGAATPPGAAWAKRADELLSHGQIEELVHMIEKLPAIAAFPGASRSIPEMEADYFLSNAQRMRYPTFRAKGMHIGSGIAEAACKTVVSTRAKKSGMRWTPDGLDAVLALRTCVLNQSYDSFWDQARPLLAA